MDCFAKVLNCTDLSIVNVFGETFVHKAVRHNHRACGENEGHEAESVIQKEVQESYLVAEIVANTCRDFSVKLLRKKVKSKFESQGL